MNDQHSGLNCFVFINYSSIGRQRPLTQCNCRLLLLFSPLGQFLMQHSSTISSYLFSFISQDNSPSSVCVEISGPIFGAQNTERKGIQVCNLMGVNHYKILMVWANMEILKKRLQVVCRWFQQWISPFCIRHKAKLGDWEEKQTWTIRSIPWPWRWVLGIIGSAYQSAQQQPSSPIFLKLLISLLQEVFYDSL